MEKKKVKLNQWIRNLHQTERKSLNATTSEKAIASDASLEVLGEPYLRVITLVDLTSSRKKKRAYKTF